jgi:Zn-dependent peptidase ImmA (M78 family)
MLNPVKQRSERSDRFLVERFTTWLPGWNRRQLQLEDFERLATGLGIAVVEAALDEADGYAFWVDRSPYIYLKENLSYAKKVIAAYHELAHILYHPADRGVFRRTGRDLWNWPKCDRQAEIVGSIAWMPDSEARSLTVEELMEFYGIEREVAEFRAGLHLWMM